MPHLISSRPSYAMDGLSRFQNSGVENMAEYDKMYKQSIEDPEGFWSRIAGYFKWKTPPRKEEFFSYNFNVSKGAIEIRWMANAETNICYNALDRNVENGLGGKVAFYWEGNDVNDSRSITYDELLTEVCKFSSVLRKRGVKKGDCVTIYLPMILETVTAMLSCARIGAIHNVVFGGFSADSLAERILDSRSSLLITADGAWRGTKIIHLKEIADSAVAQCSVKGLKIKTIVVRHLRECLNGVARSNKSFLQSAKRPEFDLKVSWNSDVDCWWHEEMLTATESRDPEWVNAEAPLFLLYTSGSTGKPKGVVHSTGGYMLYTATTFQYTFRHRSEDVYFCTADIGWITGHSYGVYGPLLQGATSVIFQGIPTHPHPGRYWAVVEKYKVTTFYTAPTAIRSLMKYPDTFVSRYNLKSLKILGTVGEPINPEAWHWFHDIVGGEKCDIVDTYWQSETGGHVITPLPRCTPLKPGAATLPFFGVMPAILNDLGKEIEGPGEGYLVFKKPWPGMTRGLYQNQDRFAATYFRKFPGYYFSGDGASRDSNGYYSITGRMDDMLNVSGHLLSTAEVESVLIEHRAVAESAAVSQPHPVKGECLYCFVTLKEGFSPTSSLTFELKGKVREKIGCFADPDCIHYAQSLPKTRSGKILRRILRQISRNERDFGDLSTLTEESIIEELFATRPSLPA